MLMVGPTAVLVACSLAVAAAAGPLYALSERAADELLDRDSTSTRSSGHEDTRPADTARGPVAARLGGDQLANLLSGIVRRRRPARRLPAGRRATGQLRISAAGSRDCWPTS